MEAIKERVSGEHVPILLMVLPIVLILITGVLGNLSTMPMTQTYTTSNNNIVLVCRTMNSAGSYSFTLGSCPKNNAITILDPSSPYTLLLQGNILGFPAALFNVTQSPLPNSVVATGQVFYDCSIKTITFFIVKEVECLSANQNTPLAPINSVWDFSIQNGPNMLQNNTTYQLNYGAPYSGSCKYTSVGSPPTNSLTNCSFTTPTNSGSSGTLVAILAFIAGILLLIISLGLTIQGTAFTVGGGAGSNDFGSKQAAVVGLGFLIFSFFTSEFGTTISGLNSLISGLGDAVNIILTFSFVIGVFWSAQTYL